VPDITDLILQDHEWFRRQFVALDDLRRTPQDDDALRRVWDPLGARLDVHAIAEEKIFYPNLLEFGEDPEDETLDAIGDHNDIRDGIHDAARHPLGTPEWWAAVGRARAANDEHMAEEEREGIADFRAHAPSELRESLGSDFGVFLDQHPTAAGLDASDKDPDSYVRDIEDELGTGGSDGSLGIGSLKGR